MGIGDGDWGWTLGIGGVGDVHGASGMGILMGIRVGMGTGDGECFFSVHFLYSFG